MEKPHFFLLFQLVLNYSSPHQNSTITPFWGDGYWLDFCVKTDGIK